VNKKGERLSGEERRKQIIEAALDLFAEKGFRGTRTKEIAERVGISETLIFQHFISKEELYRSVLVEFFGDHPIQPEVEDKVEARDDWGFFYNVATHFIKHSGEDPRIIRLAIYRILEGSNFNDVTHLRDKKRPGLYDILRDYIQKRIEEGAFKKTNTRVVAKLFLEALLIHVINKELKMMSFFPPITDEETVENLVNTFLFGLKE